MLHKILSLTLAVLATGTFLGCKKEHGPAPGCYTGRVVGATCVDGVLIDVDPAFVIGAPAYERRNTGDVLLGRNVIAVLNSQALSNMGRPGSSGTLSTIGTHLYFNTVPGDSALLGPRCLAADGLRGNFPRVGLINISTTGCQVVGPVTCGTR